MSGYGNGYGPRFDWPLEQPHDVEAKIREIQAHLKMREHHIANLGEEMRMLTEAISQNDVVSGEIWQAEVSAEQATDTTGITAMEHEEEDVSASMHQLQKALVNVQHQLQQTTHEVRDLERQLEDLKSCLNLARHELTDAQRQALSEMAVLLEQHTPLSEPLPAIVQHHAGRQHREHHSSVQTATEILKLFNHAAHIAAENRDFVASLLHQHHHELHHLIGMLPPDVQHLIAA